MKKNESIKLVGKKGVLKVIDGWSLPEKEHNGYRNLVKGDYLLENGMTLNGFFERAYSNMVHVLALGNGYVLSKYRYPKVNHCFDSKMHRWQNLYYCGGYGIDMPDGTEAGDDWKLLDDVIEMKKPAGTIVGDEDIIREMKLYLKNKNVSYRVRPHFQGKHKELIVAQKGSITEYIDLRNVFDVYRLFAQKSDRFQWSVMNEKYLSNSLNRNIIDILMQDDWIIPKNQVQCIVTGLVLGFPLESTYAFMTGSR